MPSAAVSNLQLVTRVSLLGVAVRGSRRFNTWFLSRTSSHTRLPRRPRLLRRARLAVDLARRPCPFLSFGLLTLTRLGLGLGGRGVLDLLSLSVMAQTRDSELLVLLAA